MLIKIKKSIKKIFFFFLEARFNFCFYYKIILNRNKKIYIFDIDNTIAHTWPSLLVKYGSERERLLSLSVFVNMRKFIIDLKKKNYITLFMSHRSYLSYGSTKTWLNEIGLSTKWNELILVDSVNKKVNLIENASNRGIEITFIDDLSHGHEFGKVIFYEKEIKTLKKLPIKYFGADFINEINTKDYYPSNL